MMKNKINILVTFKLDEQSQSRIRECSDRIELTVLPVKSPEEIPAQQWAEAKVLFTQSVLPDPGTAPSIRWVQFRYVGLDRYLDYDLFHDPEVVITNMRGAITSQVAEFAVMMILAFGRRLPEIVSLQKEKHWLSNKEKWLTFIPHELRDSTVGIIGYGAIGRQVARLLKPFKATILAVKKDVLHPEDTGYTREGMGDPHGDFFERLYPIEALSSVLEESDFVVMALPLTESTNHLMNASAFEAMKPSAYFINVGRGGLVDEEALINALQESKIAGAGLDVFSEEPLSEDSPLWEMPNVIISPHMSYVSRNFNEDTLLLFLDNLNRYLADLPLHNRVGVKKGY
jgi:phosphoglycerate dehydrogenase-like enzyme